MSDSLSYDKLVYALRGLRASAYVDTASFVVLAYDYLLTFEEEWRLVWPSPMSSSKVLFLLTRYLPFVDIGITASHHFRYNMSPSECLRAYRSAGWLINLGIVIAEMILWQRTRAIWGCTRLVTIVLSLWFAANIIPDLVIFALFMDSVKFTRLSSGLQGCLVTTGSTMLVWVWIILMIHEAGVLVALLIRGFDLYRQRSRSNQKHHSNLLEIIVRDGTIFYVYIFALSVANVVIVTHLSSDLESMLATPERVAHAVLTGRLVLTLRNSAKEDNGLDEIDTVELLDTSLRFESTLLEHDAATEGTETTFAFSETRKYDIESQP